MLFQYKGFDQQGVEASGSLDAPDEKIAFEVLNGRGITVYALSEASQEETVDTNWLRKDISFGSSLLPLQQQATVAALLATLYSARLTVPEVMRLAALSTAPPKAKTVFQRTGKLLQDGQPLAKAFAAENNCFSPLFEAFMAIADNTNAQVLLFRELASFLRVQSETRQKILSALIYPAILCSAALILILIVVLYLAPSLSPLFTSVGKPMPTTLSVLLTTNSILRGYWALWIFAPTVIAFVGIAALNNSQVRAGLQAQFQRLPLIGPVMQAIALSHLAQATRLLLAAGHNLPAALRLAGEVVRTNALYGNLFNEAADSIEVGGRASDVFMASSQIPSNFKELFQIGEDTNQLPETLAAIAEALQTQSNTQTTRILSFLTPALTLFMGIGVGTLVYVLMGAILEVNELAY